MLKLVTGTVRKTDGFSLIEILVGLLIISITLSVIASSLNTGSRAIKSYGQSVEQLLPTLSYYALVTATPYALKIQNNKIEILNWSAHNTWEITNKPIAPPAPVQTKMNLDPKSAIFYTDGSNTPFNLKFNDHEELAYQIQQ